MKKIFILLIFFVSISTLSIAQIDTVGVLRFKEGYRTSFLSTVSVGDNDTFCLQSITLNFSDFTLFPYGIDSTFSAKIFTPKLFPYNVAVVGTKDSNIKYYFNLENFLSYYYFVPVSKETLYFRNAQCGLSIGGSEIVSMFLFHCMDEADEYMGKMSKN